MKRTISALIGIVLMLAMAMALVGCNKKTAEQATTVTAPSVVTGAVVEQTTAQQAADNATQKATQKAATKKATQKAATKKATQKATKKATQKATQKATEATGSPVQRFTGRYGSGRCTIDVIGVSNNTVRFKVYWSSSAYEHSEWTMSGNFQEDANGFYVYYEDGVRKDITYNEDGTQQKVENRYVGGKGSFRFNGNKMTWTDNAEHAADGMIFSK